MNVGEFPTWGRQTPASSEPHNGIHNMQSHAIVTYYSTMLSSRSERNMLFYWKQFSAFKHTHLTNLLPACIQAVLYWKAQCALTLMMLTCLEHDCPCNRL